MADVAPPSYSDYGTMMNMNPIAYGQAMQQQGLAQQFSDQSLQQQQQKTLADVMANQQTSQMNPLLVQQQAQTNEGKGYANQLASTQASIDKATAPDQYNAKVRQMALQATDDQLKQREQQIWNLPRDTSQQEANFQREYGKLRDVQAFRSKAAVEQQNAMALKQQEGANAANVAGISAGASKYSADKMYDARTAVADIMAQTARQKAEVNQNLQQRITQLSRSPQTPDVVQQIEYLKSIGQQMAPAYGTAINLPGLAAGGLSRNADVQAPTMAPNAPTPSSAPTSPSDFNAQWSTLKSGQTLVGPDGKTYTKR